MPVKDIYKEILTHQLEGLMFHDSMADYFLALDAKGFYAMAKRRFCEEMREYQCTKEVYAKCSDDILKPDQVGDSDLVPASWYSDSISLGKTEMVAAVRNVFARWLEWEKSACEFYKDVYSRAQTEELIGAMHYIDKLYMDVVDEIEYVRGWIFKLTSYDFDLKAIHGMQRELAETM